MTTLALLSTLISCGPGFSGEDATAAVEAASKQANPPGRLGVELLGRSRWVNGSMFKGPCLHDKDLAFTDDPANSSVKGQPISPTWQNQRYITADTDKGWCVLLGSGLTVNVGEPKLEKEAYVVPVTFSMSDPTPWFSCLNDSVVSRQIKVTADDQGQPVIEGDLALFQDDCPQPMPEGEERGAGRRPTEPAPKAPTRDEVLALMKAFDQELWDKDRLGALEMISCYNLHNEAKYGSCAASDLIQVGPHPRGELRPGDGNPWLEYVIADFDDVRSIRRDRQVKSIYHVLMKHKRNGRDRSLAVEWVDGEWKLVGVIGALGADLTSVRFVYDLHRRDKMDVFLRRMEGEELDEQGNPLNPDEEEEEG